VADAFAEQAFQHALLDHSGLLDHRPRRRNGLIDAGQDFGNAALFVERWDEQRQGQ
jgi:hypothetical protein